MTLESLVHPGPAQGHFPSRTAALQTPGCGAWPWQEELLEPRGHGALGTSFGHYCLDLAAKTYPTSLKGSALLHPQFQKSWPRYILLLLPTAHYHQSQPRSWPHINST